MKLNDYISISDEKVPVDYHIREENGEWTIRDASEKLVLVAASKAECLMWICNPHTVTMEE